MRGALPGPRANWGCAHCTAHPQHISIAPPQVAYATRGGRGVWGGATLPKSLLYNAHNASSALASTRDSTGTVKGPSGGIAAERTGPGSYEAAWAEMVRERSSSSLATQRSQGAFTKIAMEGGREGRHVRAGWGGFCRDPADRAPS